MVAGCLGAPATAGGQSPCSAPALAVLQSGWLAYRADSNEVAAARFETAQRLCPNNIDAQVGLGFALLRLGRVQRADSLFEAVLARTGTNSDAWEGRARAALRLGDTAAALSSARSALALAPNNRELRSFADRIQDLWHPATPSVRRRPDTLQLVARTRGKHFEVNTGYGWQPFYIKGINLGAALPGRFPSEFPADSATYAGWLDAIAGMHANTIRVYTILPPAFYRALRAWNLSHPNRAVWLIHGVWTELPPAHDFANPAWEREFQEEIRNVVDVVHGASTVPAKRGHASGRYDADVSHWALGYIIGREWEPFAVKAFDARRSGGTYAGRYLRVIQGPAMDLWLARQCDAMLAYEADTYNSLRPIAYTNWPTLDPLDHPTESTTAEEAYWRKRSGRASEAKKLEYENDAIGLDANLVEATPANPAGWFACYHAYPYYPDFMFLEPRYGAAKSPEGRSSYYGYLQQLVAYHKDMPTVIAEYGVPSSRGTAHLQPQGWHHGGHDEAEMAAIDARLTREIRQAGAAGSIVFAWMDEWFKKNWAVIDYEIPRENTRLWHNVMDAEQNYGILGQYAGSIQAPTLGGAPGRWRSLPVIQEGRAGALHRLRAAADESFLLVAVELMPGKFPWDTRGFQLAIDTYLPKIGQHRLPRSGVASEMGFEFLIDLAGPDSGSLRVTPDYQRHDSRVDRATGDDFGRFSRRPVITRDRSDGRFDSLFVITNRARFGRDGTFFPARGYDRGRLRHGREAVSTLADWFLDTNAGLLELRIPWDLLNVTDPSTRSLLFDRQTDGAFGTVTAEDFHLGVLIYSKGERPSLVGALPEIRGGTWRVDDFKPWRWQGWTEPRSHSRLKPVYDSLKALWREAPSEGRGLPARRAPSD
ncbi:MAG: tetratricopeptide repeat protein [Gemmatimonadales bacterium]